MNNFYRLDKLARAALKKHGAAGNSTKIRHDINKEADSDGYSQKKAEHELTHEMKEFTGNGPFSLSDLMTCMGDYQKTTPRIYLEAAAVICHLPWPQLQLEFSSSLKNVGRLRDSCFGLIQLHVLLHRVYSFASTEPFYAMSSTHRCPHLQLPFVDKQYPKVPSAIRSNTHATYASSWSLGGMILEMETLEASM
eukprot:NODE_4713_length_772_cov_37.325035_g4369_i0.p1 GENE.NODE_4713_length_772_cov_37.325035_g4369_i0~~NODE_4713_length_772_cov_37.325035_g4369_i0.p1  ORF type:complete len:213 (-),score=42.31 NODE_4713_length_772_cov_37.325035_g4369_i0:132-713(-)